MGSTSPPAIPAPTPTPSSPSELSLALSSRLQHPSSMESAAAILLEQLVDEISLGVAIDVHRAAKTGVLPLIELPAAAKSASPAAASSASGGGKATSYATDVFGSVIQTSVGVPALKKQPECVCPNCQRNLAASRWDVRAILGLRLERVKD